MTPFAYAAYDDCDAVLADIAQHTPGTRTGEVKFIAGGTNLLDLMKENVMRPMRLVDVSRLPFSEVEECEDGALRLGALMRNADTAYHPIVRRRYPLLASAILAGASPQLRNMATNGGNLLQRTRCVYFYDTGVPCNKRSPGSGCSAIGGFTRQHAILGASEHCIATHPSDMCVGVAALDAVVHVRSARGSRSIPFEQFHRLPEDRPEDDTTLAADELITHIELPSARPFAAHSAYLKVRDRASYAFALVSVAAALDLAEDGTVRAARVAVGGVAHRPWRMRSAESLLTGAPAGAESFALLADALLREARGQGGNDFKIPLARRVIVRALEAAAAGTVTNEGETRQTPAMRDTP